MVDPAPLVTLKSAPDIQWPRYEIRLSPGLSRQEAFTEAFKAAELLRTPERPVILFSNFTYDPQSGIVNTRIKA